MWNEFEKLGDPRVHASQKYSPASEASRKGVSIDDIGVNLLDVFSLPYDKIPTVKELNDIWYPINTRLNFLENKNLEPGGKLFKLKKFNQALLKCYPDDPVMLLTASKCCAIEGDDITASKFLELAREKINNSLFWKNFLLYMKKFDRYNMINSMDSKGDIVAVGNGFSAVNQAK